MSETDWFLLTLVAMRGSEFRISWRHMHFGFGNIFGPDTSALIAEARVKLLNALGGGAEWQFLADFGRIGVAVREPEFRNLIAQFGLLHFGVDQVHNSIYMPFAREQWLTVCRAHSGRSHTPMHAHRHPDTLRHAPRQQVGIDWVV